MGYGRPLEPSGKVAASQSPVNGIRAGQSHGRRHVSASEEALDSAHELNVGHIVMVRANAPKLANTKHFGVPPVPDTADVLNSQQRLEPKPETLLLSCLFIPPTRW
jgi:hypothetical protein